MSNDHFYKFDVIVFLATSSQISFNIYYYLFAKVHFNFHMHFKQQIIKKLFAFINIKID